MLRRAFSLSVIAFVVTLAALPAPSQGQGQAQDAPVNTTVFAAASMKNNCSIVCAADSIEPKRCT